MVRCSRPVALITGAAGGIGGSIATALAGAGFDVVLADRAVSDDFERRAVELRGLGARTALIVNDLTDDAARTDFVEQAFGAFGRLDCLVNNAGVSVMSRGDILDVTPESFDRCIAVNLRAQFFLTQAVAKRMIATPSERRRSIVTVTTVAVEHHVGATLAEYAISKAGLAHSLQHWAVRLEGEGIDCYEVRPGMMKTEMTATTRGKYDALIESGFVPAGRWGDTAEVGRAVAMLASGALSYATGQTIHVDGGMRFKSFLGLLERSLAHQFGHFARQNQPTVLVEEFDPVDDDAGIRTTAALAFLDRSPASLHGVADFHWRMELDAVPAQHGDAGASLVASAHDETMRKRKIQHAMCNAAAEFCRLGIRFARMEFCKIAGHAAEQVDVRLRNRTAGSGVRHADHLILEPVISRRVEREIRVHSAATLPK